MVTIQQLGCWKLLRQHVKQLWGLILLMHTEIQSCTGNSSHMHSKITRISFPQLAKVLPIYYWMGYIYPRRNKSLVRELSSPVPGSKDLFFPTQYSQSYFSQFMACLWKQHWSYWRNPLYTAVRFLFTMIIALMFGTMFWNLGSKT